MRTENSAFDRRDRPRVAVMMSGGVDSSVAAALLLDQGYEVIGFTLRLASGDDTAGCCGSSAETDARRAARVLGIRHYLLDCREIFQREIAGPFRLAYLSGVTPNPCVDCNEKIKFGFFPGRARDFSANLVATGHYARVARGETGPELLRGADRRRDQSYFLYRVPTDTLAGVLFPLGGMTKEEVRALARSRNLPNAEKKGSQEICFIPVGSYRAFVTGNDGAGLEPGPILDLENRVLGRHRGIACYTVGQREGLGVSGPRPLYVVAIAPGRNAVVVGERKDAFRSRFTTRDTRWFGKEPAGARRATVQVRYRSAGIPATVTPRRSGTALVELDEPQFAVTPGQAAVFYRGEKVLGGGIIMAENPVFVIK